MDDRIAVEQDWIGAVQGLVWPEESAHVGNAVQSRRREFEAGRVLARRALARFGAGDCPIPALPDRRPLWPAGFTGSIAHTRARVAAAVGRTGEITAVGIDLEDAARFGAHLEPRILRPEEIASALEGRSPDARQTALAVLFSVKEAFYKCQYPLTRQFLDFHDVRAEIDFAQQEFEIALLTPLPALADTVFRGRFRAEAGAVAAAMVLEAGGRSWLT